MISMSLERTAQGSPRKLTFERIAETGERVDFCTLSIDAADLRYMAMQLDQWNSEVAFTEGVYDD